MSHLQQDSRHFTVTCTVLRHCHKEFQRFWISEELYSRQRPATSRGNTPEDWGRWTYLWTFLCYLSFGRECVIRPLCSIHSTPEWLVPLRFFAGHPVIYRSCRISSANFCYSFHLHLRIVILFLLFSFFPFLFYSFNFSGDLTKKTTLVLLFELSIYPIFI